MLIPNRVSPNGYPTVRPAELQSVILSHQVDSHKTLTTHKLACSCFVTLFGHQYIPTTSNCQSRLVGAGYFVSLYSGEVKVSSISILLITWFYKVHLLDKLSPTWSLRRHQAICLLSVSDGRYVYQISRAHRMHSRP